MTIKASHVSFAHLTSPSPVSLMSRDIGIPEHLLTTGVRASRMLFEVSWSWGAFPCIGAEKRGGNADRRALAEGTVFVFLECQG